MSPSLTGSVDATAKSNIAAPKDETYENDTRLSRPKPGARSTFRENTEARALFIDLHQDQFWNPWGMEERATDLERAQQIMEEWQRAEPDHKPKSRLVVTEILPYISNVISRALVDRATDRREATSKATMVTENNIHVLIIGVPDITSDTTCSRETSDNEGGYVASSRKVIT